MNQVRGYNPDKMARRRRQRLAQHGVIALHGLALLWPARVLDATTASAHEAICRFGDGDAWRRALGLGSVGEQNTRESIFAAMQRKETFGTARTHPRYACSVAGTSNRTF